MSCRPTLLACALLIGCDAAIPLPDGADAPPDRLAEAAHRRLQGAETEGRPSWREAITLADGSRVIQDERGILRDDSLLSDAPAGRVQGSESHHRFAYVERVDGGPQTRIVACHLAACTPLPHSGHPDRLAISPDGSWLAFVASLQGLPAVHIADFEGGAAQALTNVDLEREGPGPPPGFVPPPHEGPLRFDGDHIVWTSAEGPHAVRWR